MEAAANVVPFGESTPPSDHNEMTLARAAKGAVEIIDTIEEAQAKIDAINEESKSKKAPHQDEIAKLKKQIRDDYNIEAKALSTIITKRRQERRMKARIEALEKTAAEQFKQMEMEFSA
jgi:hypothetical protein